MNGQSAGGESSTGSQRCSSGKLGKNPVKAIDGAP